MHYEITAIRIRKHEILMSITIYIETNSIGGNAYEFIQTFNVDNQNVNERIIHENHADRMIAAMTNLGYACKWLTEERVSRGAICILKDQDGKDQKYGGEHDDLFEAVHSQTDYDDNRIKYSLIYGRHVSYLDRIRHLANSYEIAFTQNTEVQQSRERFNDPNDPLLIVNRHWTRENITKLKLYGDRNVLECVACQKSIAVQQTDNFTGFRETNAKTDRPILIKTNKQLMDNFIELHLRLHIPGYGEVAGKRKKKRQKGVREWRN